MPDQPGCLCEGFASALRERFIEKRGDKHYLADQSHGMSLLYGPAITHCPFCGSVIGAAPELPRAVKVPKK